VFFLGRDTITGIYKFHNIALGLHSNFDRAEWILGRFDRLRSELYLFRPYPLSDFSDRVVAIPDGDTVDVLQQRESRARAEELYQAVHQQ
jgi:hypothetical protein